MGTGPGRVAKHHQRISGMTGWPQRTLLRQIREYIGTLRHLAAGRQVTEAASGLNVARLSCADEFPRAAGSDRA